ncbi:YCF48-related protein [Pseudomonas lopnurensis]|uniref:YCF48-related protein n=1 Tax=Pseudomonas lopnurensis TaxID=1477517 RepID=UPI0028AE63A6|nr:YCF48-related protein [Pseudomonas lopnurensis]
MCCAALLPLSGSAMVQAARIDTLAEPARPINVPVPMLGVDRAGDALISVGLHGQIRRSIDGGATWQQVPSPVSSDLVQVRFRDAQHGWIVGHDAVLLHSRDGGSTWELQLDGRKVLARLREFYDARAAAGDQNAEEMLQELDFAMTTSSDPDVLASPFLDVLFDASGQGFVVGAFGLILRSTDDGATWEPWMEHTDNPRRMHLYGLEERDGTFYVSGEQGLLMRLKPDAEGFSQIETPYNGTYFGVRALPGLLLAHGLRGNLYVSRDEGANWQQVRTGMTTSLVSVVAEEEGRVILVSQSGAMAVLDALSLAVTPLKSARLGEVFSASGTAHDGQLVLTALSGAALVDIVRGN